MAYLAGDIGGTSTRLAIVENGMILRQDSFASGRFPGLADIVKRFLAVGPALSVTRACFGVAGPVVADSCQATNLPWQIDARTLESELNITRVVLVNDFHAMATGIAELPQSEFLMLNNVPSEPAGPWALIGAGTGLGEAIIVKGPVGFEVLSSEGSHTDFAPRNELEIELLRFLLKRHHRVSYDRIVSGPGLVKIYEFLREMNPALASKAVDEKMRADPIAAAAIISGHGLSSGDELCSKALDLFVSIYGAEAGNLGLKVIAKGGIFIGGGIAPKILPKLKDGVFMKAFLDKGRMSPLLERTPVKVVLNTSAGLLGAAVIAAQARL